MYKLIAIDIDGTLINDRKELTNEVIDAIQSAKAKGVKVVISTGRPIGGVLSLIEELKLNEEDEYVITYNGAVVQSTLTNEVISEVSLTYQDLKELYELSIQVQSPMHFFDSESIYTPNKDINKYTVHESHINQVPLHYRTIDEIPEDMLIPKVMFIDEPERLQKVIDAIPNSFREKYAMVQSAPFFLEILHPSVSKGNAVKQLAEKLSIKREEVICIGDGENDLSMVEYAGCGVAMGNAVSSIKEAAQFETLSNNENGVAYAIEKLVLN
ncbi:sugar-phosphatase [Bacillus sp. BRMEA1]|uniref:sugar-phosphatase n=1 Tax=Neobacillus endophyticus TaxID=2738405 RepID=UPI001564822F|nr:sugar-phosphatase [Neobacillus endophyticus]NRD77732.1 sugar-phosphatase [Neobacillus endophyticus]